MSETKQPGSSSGGGGVTRLRSNVKGGCDVELAPCTLLVGANASGKTAVAEALALALRGESPEVGATPSSLMELVAPSERLFVEATLGGGAPSDGSNGAHEGGEQITFEVKGTTARATRPVWLLNGQTPHLPPGALLVSEVAALLQKGGKGLREALLAICCGAVSSEDIDRRIPKAYHETWETMWSAAQAKQPSIADALVAVAKSIRDGAKDARAQSKAAGTEREADPPSVDPDVVEAAATDAEKCARAHREAEGAHREAGEARARRDQVLASLPSLRARVEAASSSASGTAASPGALQAAEGALAAIEAAVGIAGAHPKRCVTCGGDAPAGGWDDRLALLFTKRDEVKASITAHRAQPRVAALDAAQRRLAEAEQIAKSEIQTGPPADAIVALREAAEVAASHLRDLQRAQAERSAWEDKLDAATRATDRAEMLAALAKCVDRIVRDVLVNAVDAFTARVTNALPEGVEAAVQLFDGSRSAVCRVGIVAESVEGVEGVGSGGGKASKSKGTSSVRSWRALSGAERTALVAAFAAAWGAGRDQAEVRVVIVDDVWLDSRALAALCAALHGAVASGAISQAIICAVDDYGLDTPGWKRVRVGGAARKAEAAPERQRDGNDVEHDDADFEPPYDAEDDPIPF